MWDKDKAWTASQLEVEITNLVSELGTVESPVKIKRVSEKKLTPEERRKTFRLVINNS